MWRTYPVTEEFNDVRIDAAIARLTGLSRAEVQRLIDTGDVLLDGNPVAKSVRLRAQSILEINIPTPRTVAPRGEMSPSLSSTRMGISWWWINRQVWPPTLPSTSPARTSWALL